MLELLKRVKMNLTDIRYLNLNFNELPESNSIIFGYNGVGKQVFTTHYKQVRL